MVNRQSAIVKRETANVKGWPNFEIRFWFGYLPSSPASGLVGQVGELRTSNFELQTLNCKL